MALAVRGSGHRLVYGILQSAGLLFFAFAGYARIATLGEEVRDPETTIPRAIPRALVIVVVLYAVVAVALLAVLGRPASLTRGCRCSRPPSRPGSAGWERSSGSPRCWPASAPCSAWSPGSAAPRWRWPARVTCRGTLARVDETNGVPQTAQVVVCAVVVLLVVAVDVRTAIGFSSFGVLVYYAVANAAALTQEPEQRHWPRGLHVVGLVGCALLVVTLPWSAVITGLVVSAIGLAGRRLFRRPPA